jgi:predicted nucleic acid-binding protein
VKKIGAVPIIIDSRTDVVASWLTNVPLSQVAKRMQKDTLQVVSSRDLTDERLLAWAAAAEDRYLQAMAKKQEVAASTAAWRRRHVDIPHAKGSRWCREGCDTLAS